MSDLHHMCFLSESMPFLACNLLQVFKFSLPASNRRKVQVNSHQKSVGSTAADPWPMPPWRPWPPWRPCQADTAFKQNFEHRQERIWPKTDQTTNYWWWKAETKNTKTPDTPGAEKILEKTNVSPCRVSVACRLPHWDAYALSFLEGGARNLGSLAAGCPDAGKLCCRNFTWRAAQLPWTSERTWKNVMLMCLHDFSGCYLWRKLQ